MVRYKEGKKQDEGRKMKEGRKEANEGREANRSHRCKYRLGKSNNTGFPLPSSSF
jgi:hypothetical protein